MNISDDHIISALLPYGINASSDFCSKIRVYIDLLLRWNRQISLTTVTNPKEILRFHFGESVFAATALRIDSGRLADVGTGAGFPGLPIKLARPHLELYLIESNSKKVVFLREIVRAMSLDHVEIIRSRAEDLSANIPAFDIVTARAVGKFEKQLSWAGGRVTFEGRLILWLGEADLRSIANLQGWSWRDPIHIPGSEKRYLLQGSRNR